MRFVWLLTCLATRCALGASMAGATAGVVDAATTEHTLYAPYVDLERGEKATLTVVDETRRGALVRVQLLRRDGQPMSLGGHPITLSRAIPPGEAMQIDLGRFSERRFEGSLTLVSNRVVSATLRLSETQYPLIAATSGATHLVVDAAMVGDLFLALTAGASAPVDAGVMRVRVGTEEPLGRVRLEPLESTIWRVPERLVAGDVILLDSVRPLAVLLLSGDAATRLVVVGPALR